MTFAATVRVNQTHIAEIKAQKNEPYQDSNTAHTYDYEVRQYAVPPDPIVARDKMRDPGDPIVKTGIVQHRYRDGALTLLAKIIQDSELGI